MVISQQDIRSCRRCGNIFSLYSQINYVVCPLCKSKNSEKIHLM